MTSDRTAALIVIGNEILSGKVADTNSLFLAQQLRVLGVTLRRIVVIPDEIDVIADAIRSLRTTVDVIFTSGGVGPTHDDVTIAGVAQGLGRAVIRHPSIESKLREFFGGDVNEARLKLADVVDGTELEYVGNLSFPTFRVENIYILPGIPEIFREKFLALRERFSAAPFHLRVVYVRELESAIAESLNSTLAQFPELLLGSYPKLNDPEYRVRVTLESKDVAYVERALEVLLALLPAEAVVRTE
jgi:molybdenum cofactor synthesis domain-containing protein